jgi:putative endopeptidase
MMRRARGGLGWVALWLVSASFAQDAGKPMYGSWGLDVAGMDHHMRPGDDFYRYANGTWSDQTSIAPDRSAVSLRLAMTDLVESRLKDMLEANAAHVSNRPVDLPGKTGAFYKAFMDEGRAESLGSKPIAAQLEAVRAAKSRTALSRLMGRANSDFETSLFVASIGADRKDPSHYALYLSQGGLGLPDRDYYLQADFAKQKAAYETYVAQLLQWVQWPDAARSARDVVAFETKIAQGSWTRVQDRDLNATYNAMSVSQLQQLAGGVAWKSFFAALRVPEVDRVVVAQNSAFPKIADAFTTTPIETLQAWQAFHIADNAAPFLSSAFANAWFELHKKALAGQQQEQVRWKRAITAVSGGDFLVGDHFGTFGTMGWGVGQLYVAKYFPPDSKAKIESLVHNLLKAYRARIEALDWMSPATRAEAIRKLGTYRIKVGYPAHWRDYSRLLIADDDLTGDVIRAGAADWAFQVGRVHSLVDVTDWIMTPQTNDAYNGSLRDIVLPAAMLQPPVFDPNADPAINYGAVGGVIGHELTHGFDDQGRELDARGALRDWWTKDDALEFETRSKRLGAQYSAFHPLPSDSDLHVNGELTMGENIADLGGLTLGVDAYHAWLDGAAAPVLDGITGDQRVFLGWAQAWRNKRTEDALKQQIVSDPHSPAQFRVNGVVRNVDAWYAAFDVKPGDKLYLAPENRVRIW